MGSGRSLEGDTVIWIILAAVVIAPLAFIGLVAYLLFNGRQSERLSDD